MELIIKYIKPELIIVSAVLYFIGKGLKQSKLPDEKIPVTLGCIGIAICAFWVFATSTVATLQDVLLCLFTVIVQGILVAGLSVYTDQLRKQSKEKEEK